VKTTPTPARKAKTSEPRPRSRAPRSKAAAAPKKAGAKKKTKAGTALSVDVSKIAGTRKAAMPDFVPPELATLSDVAPGSGDWVHEIKFDGYRIQARIDGDAITLKTRTGLDWTDRFSPIAEACTGFGPHAVLLDGEIVSGDENGVSDFSALQDDLKTGRYDRLAYYVFDILHLDGYDLTGAALIDRKQVLYDLFAEAPGGSVIRASEHFETDGSVMLDHACQMQLEGIVSKRRNAPYRSGRSGDWLKVKCANAQEFVIAGYEPSDKNSRAIRSLLLAYYDKDGLRYAGRVGTGWGEAKERDLSRRLAEVAADKPPFDKVPEEERRRKVKWVEPKLVAEVEFRGWTGGKLLRQASFKGLREDKPAREVVREVSGMSQTKQAALRQKTPVKKAAEKGRRATPAAPAKAPSRATSKNEVTVAGVKLTHPERMYWEDAGITKEDLAKYYEKVWDWMAPHVTNRVVALVRCPEGATAECFFQKHASAGLMEKRLHMVAEPDGNKAISVDDLPGVISLVQAGVLEIHTRGSTIEHLEEADRLVFDLDPGPGIEFKDIAEAAREVRDGLRALELESFLKNTGGKGLHVVLPIEPTPWDPAKEFCRRFAEGLARLRPDRYTTTIKKTARNNKIFIDYLRNSREATAIAPYSTRARPGATVSVPLIWEELRTLKIPNPFTVQNLPKRLAKLRKDPWEGIGKLKQHLPDLSKLK
jgi:bifunctional non-homologous end joining protein LigD